MAKVESKMYQLFGDQLGMVLDENRTMPWLREHKMLISVLNPVLCRYTLNTIPAQEIKRCGISAVDELLKNGPVHIIKNNRPQYVVLTEEAYAQLTAQQLEQADQMGGDSLWDWLEHRPWKGTRTREEIDTYLRAERDAWDDER